MRLTIVNWSTQEKSPECASAGASSAPARSSLPKAASWCTSRIPAKPVGDGADRSVGPVETFRSLPPNPSTPAQLTLFDSR